MLCIKPSSLLLLILAFLAGGMPGAEAREARASQPYLFETTDTRQLTMRAYDLSSKDSLDAAIRLYSIAAHRYRPEMTHDEKYYAVIAMNNIGSIYLAHRNNPEAAYPWLNKALKAAQVDEFNVLLPGIYDNLANLSANFGDYDSALELFRKGFRMTFDPTLDSMHHDPNTRYGLMVMVFNDMVALCMEHDRLADIKSDIEEFSQVKFPDIPMADYSVNLSKALMSLMDSKASAASGLLSKGHGMINIPAESLRYVINDRLYSAKASSSAGNPSLAIRYLDTALLEARNGKLDDLLPKLLLEKAKLLPEKSKELQLMAYQVRDSLYGVRSMSKFKDLQSSEAINAIATEKAALAEKHRRRMLAIYVMGSAMAIILLLVVMLIVRNRKLSLANRAMVNSHIASKIEKKLAEERTPKAIALPIDESKKMELTGMIRNILASSQEVFSPDFSLDRLGELTSTRPKYLSAIINDSFGRNLSTLLAETRIRKACDMLADPEYYPSLTLDAIATEVGYRSRTHFSAVFKKLTGMTPSKWASIVAEERKSLITGEETY